MQQKRRAEKPHRKQDTAAAVTVLMGFACALLLTRVRLHEWHAPLALSLLLAFELTDTDSRGVLGGIVLGALLCRPVLWLTCVIAGVSYALFRILPKVKKPLKRTRRFLLFATVGTLSVPLYAANGADELLNAAAAVLLSLLASPLFVQAIKSVKTADQTRVFTVSEQAVFAAVFGCLLPAADGAVFFGWSLAVMLLTLGTMVAVTVRGVYGVAAATLWASMLALYCKAEPALLGSIAVAALLASMLRSRGRAFVFLSFVLSGVLFETYAATDALTMNVQNLLSASLFYFLLPRKWLDTLSDRLCAERQAERMRMGTIRRIEQTASERIGQMGDLLVGFSSMFAPLTQDEDAVVRWTVQAALTVCSSCEIRSDCWQDAAQMQQTVLQLAKAGDAGKRVTTVDPIHPYCAHFADLCAAIVLSYQQALAREAVYEQARQQSAFANKQFSGVGDTLIQQAKHLQSATREQAENRRRVEERLAALGAIVLSFDWLESDGNRMFSIVLQRPLRVNRETICNEIERACGFRLRNVKLSVEKQSVAFVFEQDARLHASMRVSKTAETDAPSGDATGECRLTGGRVCFALSDGMGRGASARAESEAAIALLFRLYRAGMARELIYDTVNRLLMARSETETYATLDAVAIDLNTGEAEFLKYGAPPSFLLRDGTVTALDGEALPCGILAEAKPSVIRMQLQSNDRLVFCTDGVQDVLPDGTEQTLKNLFDSRIPVDTTLLKIAESRKGTDDMTVMVIHVA